MKKVWIPLVLVLVVLAVGYGLGIGYYADKFQVNTQVGAVDVSNLTLDQARTKLADSLMDQEISLVENGHEIGQFKVADLHAQISTEDMLTDAFNNQNPNRWLEHFFRSQTYQVPLANSVEVSEPALIQVLSDMGLDNSDRLPAENASIQYRPGQGYSIEAASPGTQLDSQKLVQLVEEGIQSGQGQVDIAQAYIEPAISEDDPELQGFMDQIHQASDTQITLVIDGQEETIPAEIIETWIHFNPYNQIVFDPEMIHDYLGELNDKYATFSASRTFESTYRGTVTVPPGTLGWSINRQLETEQIQADLEAGQDVKREPVIDGTGYGQEGDDIGGSYVEVDIVNQTMFIYRDHQLVLETPIVTGQVGTDTVPGAYSVWDKELNAELTGYNPRTGQEYAQPVSYWLPFDDTGQGIHDANWQGSFGGDTYLYAGSLGCINTPPSVMPQVFDLVDLGMPVIIFE